MYTHTYIHTTISEKGGHEFGRDQGGVYERVWREERERRNEVIIMSKILNKKSKQTI